MKRLVRKGRGDLGKTREILDKLNSGYINIYVKNSFSTLKTSSSLIEKMV